jgi:tetratricopeptide (TPR) repeat protein
MPWQANRKEPCHVRGRLSLTKNRGKTNAGAWTTAGERKSLKPESAEGAGPASAQTMLSFIRIHNPAATLALLLAIFANAGGVLFLACLALTTAAAQQISVLNERWVEVKSPHFTCYSSARTQDVCRVTIKLEQFYRAYACLAGTQAVASPPIVVIAFKDAQAMHPFVPPYQGQPGSMAAFCQPSEDQNLIVMALAGDVRDPMLIVYHEYTHLLLRRNELFWPIWLHEGMAEIYATFQMRGEDKALMALPFGSHIGRLNERGLMPLAQLLAVTHDSPEYNAKDLQPFFYAQSWLLTHYLISGNPKRLPQFGRYSLLLKAGESPEQAFIHAFEAPLSVMETELRQYLQRGRFPSQRVILSNAPTSGKALQLRSLAGDELCFHIGDLLFRIKRTNEAKAWFEKAKGIAPASPLPYEGLGVLAAREKRSKEALQAFRKAFEYGSSNYLAHYTYARLILGSGTNVSARSAEDAQRHLQKAVSLMPNAAPAYFQLGRLELRVKGAPAKAEEHLRRAAELSPENPVYALVLGQAQLACGKSAEGRATLQELLRPYVPDDIRRRAEQLLQSRAVARRPITTPPQRPLFGVWTLISAAVAAALIVGLLLRLLGRRRR